MDRIKKFFMDASNKIRGWWVALLATVLGIGGVVVSQTVTDVVRWAAPTERVDGTALPSAQLREYRVSMGTTPGGSKAVVATILHPTLTATVPRGSNPIGTRCYTVTAVDINGMESAPSGEVCKSINAIPNAPSGVTVQ